ncbi:trimeric intracellular cation channel family protein [Methylonatrum kenyense]|uniref:trimeric intracellular cation channel family protein n=1 Tax=Methylonatrum kenyense TaxID=455253 RepID=UPI0020C15074|nr:trimeric intracellular cation channel family protein [Methylonatrum kenyense]MCK8517340.1 trimeric intracellular cation channel family protein [Methylonatrum kenyense]
MFQLLDLFGTAVFAVSGALAAGRKHLDLFGVLVLAIVTAIGGGTLRDLTLGLTPVFWIQAPSYLWIASIAGLVTVLLARYRWLHRDFLPIADAIGLATFCVIGAERALAAGVHPATAVLMGVMTGVFGGMIRDVLCGEVPLVLRKELYATAALAGSSIMVVLSLILPGMAIAAWAGLLTALALRLAAIRWQLGLPVFRHGD